MSLSLKQFAVSVATAAVFGAASGGAAAESPIKQADTGYGLAYEPKVKVSCGNGQAAPKIVDLRALDNNASGGRVSVDLDSFNTPSDNNNRGTFTFDFANCKNVILPQSASAFGSTVKGTAGNDDILVGDNGFTNIAGVSGNDRVFINADISTVNFSQNGSYVSVRFKNSANADSLTNVQNVATVCANNGSVVLPSNTASQASYGPACPVPFAGR